MWGRGAIGGPFALTDHTGRPAPMPISAASCCWSISVSPLSGYLPDRPDGGRGALNSLGAQADEVRALFISLDPQRDTPKALLSTYVVFHQTYGLTGNEQSIRRAANAYKVYSRKRPEGKKIGTASISAYIYLMDRDGKFVGCFRPARRRSGWPTRSVRWSRDPSAGRRCTAGRQQMVTCPADVESRSKLF